MQKSIFSVLKNVLALVICITMLLGTCLQGAAATPTPVANPTTVPGDIDADGVVNLKDLVRLARYVAIWDVEYNPYAIDVNGDGTPNLDDVTYLAQYLAGWDKEDGIDVPTITVPKEKFATKFTNNSYIYRVGNKNTVALSSLFEIAEGVETSAIDNISVLVTDANNNVLNVYTEGTGAWDTGKIDFADDFTGIVNITINMPDDEFCLPTTISVEVVDAVNATSAASATSNNVVLLNDVTNGSFSVSSGYAFYGNGFTITLNPNNHSTARGAGFDGYVHMNGGTIDNVRIEGPVFAAANIYRVQGETGTGADDPVNYFRNALIIHSGDCIISNSYISGARTAIYVKNGGDVLIENTTVSGGAYANIEVSVANSITFRNLVTEQKASKDSYSQNKDMIGIGIVVDNENTDVFIEGALNQYNWITKAQWSAMLGSYENQFPALFTEANYSKYWHYCEGDTETKYVNLGMIFACDWNSSKLHDNRQDKTIEYTNMDVTVAGKSGGVFSVTNAGTLTEKLLNAPERVVSVQYPVAPKYSFDYKTEDNYQEYTEGSNVYCYEDGGIVKISFDAGASKIWNTSILTVTKEGNSLPYTVSMNGSDYTGKSITFTEGGDYKVIYTYTDPYNYKLVGNEISTYSKEYQKIVNITVNVVEKAAKNAEFTMGTQNQSVNKIPINNSIYLSASGLDNSSWTSGTGLKFPKSDGDTSTISFKYSGKTNGSWGSATINGQTFYFPVVAMGTTDSKWSHTGGWYGCFPVFEGAIAITDYADGGTGSAVTYNSSTTTMPANLSALYPQTVFRYQGTQSKVPTTPSKMTKGTYNGKLCYTTQTDLSASNERGEEWNLATYQYIDNKGTTYYYYVAYYCAASTSGSCVTPDTLVTLADGSKVRIDSLTGTEQLLVWNHQTGKLESAPVAYIVNHDEIVKEYNISHLYFSDGSEIKIIGEHVFFDATLNKYVALTTENAKDFIEHNFVGLNSKNNAVGVIKLENVKNYTMQTSAYEVVSYQHLTCFTNNVLSTSAYLDKLLNIFDINPETLAYTPELVQKDIETYGLYTYADFEGLISEEAFELYNAAYLKIAVGKGYITWDDIYALIDIYFDVNVQPIQ